MQIISKHPRTNIFATIPVYPYIDPVSHLPFRLISAKMVATIYVGCINTYTLYSIIQPHRNPVYPYISPHIPLYTVNPEPPNPNS